MGNKKSSHSQLAIREPSGWPLPPWTSMAGRRPVQPSIVAAVDSMDAQLVSQLIQRGHNIDKRDSNGLTALHVAAINGDERCLQVLLHAGARLVTCPPIRQTPLHFAAQNGTQSMIDMLVDYGCPVNSRDTMLTTPLAASVDANNESTAVALLRKGAAVQPSVVLAALQYGYTDMLRTLLNARPTLIGDIELSEDFKLTRVTVAGLKVLYLAGAVIDDSDVSRIKPLDWSDYCLTGHIRLPPHQYNRDLDYEAYDQFTDWMDTRPDIMPLKCLSRIAFRRACSQSGVDVAIDELTVPKPIRRYLLLQDIDS